MNKRFDVLIIGSGMSSLTAASLLARDGLHVGILEQNYLPGGCTSTYDRRGFAFESGATTLVGLDEYMPLRFLLHELDLKLEGLIRLELPMKVHLADGRSLKKHENLEEWINEVSRIFPHSKQREFWKLSYKISEFVWKTSLQQRFFPPTSFSDLFRAVRGFRPEQLRYAPYAFKSMQSLLDDFKLSDNELFMKFINEQLLITAQNSAEEVNVLFGATALCYNNFGNYYMKGGLINLVQPLLNYIESKGGEILYRKPVKEIRYENGLYKIPGKRSEVFEAEFLISGIPINNTLEVIDLAPKRKQQLESKLLASEELNSAFQTGIAFKRFRDYDTIHHQIHLEKPLIHTGSHSIFLSLSHADDKSRSHEEKNAVVASVSTHVPDPAKRMSFDKEACENQILDELEKRDLVRRSEILYMHSSAPGGWEKWTKRKHGFVGGYPQMMKIKPWQMLDARLDKHKAYICGDTTYPGQGIPGTVLSGLIAYEKLKADHGVK